jgi:hypothetical protein
MLEKLSQYTLAVELIKRHARIAIILRETKAPKKMIKKAYREMIGKSGSSGPIRDSSRGLTKNMRQFKEATLFAGILHIIEQKSTGNNIENVIQAFDFYQNTSRTKLIDFTTAWVIARDMRLKHLLLTKCEFCGSTAIVFVINEKSNDRCAVCKNNIQKILFSNKPN